MKTYQVVAPLASHWRPASCAEVDCPHFLSGWRTVLDTASQGELVKAVMESGRKPSAVLREGSTITFVFEPGTPCFKASQHRVPLEREPLYLVRGGDWRGNPRGTPLRRHVRPDDWVDDFATHQQDLADRLERG
ncbi:MAG TPA: hypothetical protein VG276_28680 [Actinomycetes bacterium]|nr:hypothetical protein [Actinomycetes bacterium]